MERKEEETTLNGLHIYKLSRKVVSWKEVKIERSKLTSICLLITLSRVKVVTDRNENSGEKYIKNHGH